MSEQPDQQAAPDFSVTVLNFQIQFPKAALQAMSKGSTWHGKVSCSVLGDQKASVIRRKLQEQHGQQYVLNPDERLVADQWNALESVKQSAEQIEQGRKPKRNLPIRKSPTTKEHSLITKAIEIFTLAGLSQLLLQYDRQCVIGKNFNTVEGESRNYAYRDLPSLLERLIDSKQTGRTLWWMDGSVSAQIEDPQAERTLGIAEQYAKKFLGKRQFENLEGRDYRCLMRFRDALGEFEPKYRMFGWEQLVGAGLSAAEEYFSDRGMIYPAHLANPKFLQIGLPQYLRRLI